MNTNYWFKILIVVVGVSGCASYNGKYGDLYGHGYGNSTAAAIDAQSGIISNQNMNTINMSPVFTDAWPRP